MQPGETATCGNCGKAILGSGAWGINPLAVCHCCKHDQRPLSAKPHGCICPPGSEATCSGLGCPRRLPYGYVLPQIHPMNITKDDTLARIKKIIEDVEHRCLAADGPVTPTHQEISHNELASIYALACGQPETWRHPDAAPR